MEKIFVFARIISLLVQDILIETKSRHDPAITKIRRGLLPILINIIRTIRIIVD